MEQQKGSTSKEMIWALRWSVALRTFYRQILSLLYSSFPFGNFRPRLVRALLVYVGISKNRGTPKSSILKGFSTINHPFSGIHIFGNTHVVSQSRQSRRDRLLWQWPRWGADLWKMYPFSNMVIFYAILGYLCWFRGIKTQPKYISVRCLGI